MRAGYLQFNPRFGEKDVNLDRVAGFLEGTKADLIVLPELFATGYIFESREELLGLAEPPGGRTFEVLAGLSRKIGSTIVAGIAELDGDRCFNSCFAFSAGSVIGGYRKVHLFDREKDLFAPGDRGFTVLEVNRVRLGLMICFDWIFPESARILALMGSQIICHPANLVLPHCPQAMITRCLENRVFAVTADRIGEESRAGLEMKFIGTSQIVGPGGEVLIRAGEEEVVRIIDIDPSLADNKMITPANNVLADRRPEFYGRLTSSQSASNQP
jgi:predicted amidohydrolase